MPPIDLYQVPASGPCRAVVMTAQSVGVELNKIYLDLFAKEQMKPEFLQMNPQHCVPTINDGGFILWESRAIQSYLVNKYAPGSPMYPKDPQARAVVDRMLYFDCSTLYKALYEYVRPQIDGKPADSEKEGVFKKALGLFEEFLRKSPYVAGSNLTIADLSIVATVTFAQVIDYNYESFPRICAWLIKMETEIPNFKEINEDSINDVKTFLKSRQQP